MTLVNFFGKMVYDKTSIFMENVHIMIKNKKVFHRGLALILATGLLFMENMTVFAARDYKAEAEARKEMPIESNQIKDWPQGPQLGAESAILMEANTGTILYAKNIDARLYPASITKILTALIAVEKSNLDDMVTYSYESVHSINWREDANMGINVGDQITMEQSLYGLLVGSANEAAYSIAQHISPDGTIEGFAKIMNLKATTLGCTNSNFITPNGIHDDNHYTSAHDMALIAQAFFSNELLCKMSSTTSYQVPQTATQPREDMIVWAKSKLLPGKQYYYEDLVGTKTGYTTQARQTLVSCAERNGLKLICVIMNEEAPNQFEDTVALFEYGFQNFEPYSIADHDTKYTVNHTGFFTSDSDFFGSSKPLMELDSSDYIVLPINASFEDTVSELSYTDLGENEIARVNYTYNDVPVGYGSLVPANDTPATFDFSTGQVITTPAPESESKTVYINVKNIIIGIIVVFFAVMLLLMLKTFIVNTRKSRRRHRIMSKRRGDTRYLDWKGFK